MSRKKVIHELEDEVIEDGIEVKCLKQDWEESLVEQLSRFDGSHVEKNAIKAIINGLIE